MGNRSTYSAYSVKGITDNFAKIIYPNVCLVCDGKGVNDFDLCQRCYDNLPWIKYACQRCALPLTSSDSIVCGACSNRELSFDHAFSAFQFEGFIRDAVYQFKFNQKLNYGKLLAQLLLNQIISKKIEIPDVVIPVPLHKNRIRSRGYNQALEIARIVSMHVDCDFFYDAIYRNRDTSVQMELPAKQRAKNVKGAFSLKNYSGKFNNKHVCVIDDVMTTGNTVNEVSKCLKLAGASKIDVWCVARVS